MKVLCLAPARDCQRFLPGYPPKGAWSFIRPSPDVSRLAALVAASDEFLYQDQRVEPLQVAGSPEVCLVYADFGCENSARETVEKLKDSGARFVLFGPLATALDDSPPDWAGPRVVGDIVNVWSEVRRDALAGRLGTVYRAARRPRYLPVRHDLGHWPAMNSRHQAMNFIRGCSCSEPVRRFCPEYLYFGAERLVRSREEIVGEVIEMPHKHIQLLDDDIAREPEYYSDVFRLLWNLRRHWTVNAGDGLFRHSKLIQLLAKAGTKTVFLNETFLRDRLPEALNSSQLTKLLHRRVKYLQARRMLVGAKVVLELDREPRLDFERVARLLSRIDLDFVETTFLTRDGGGGWQQLPVSYRPMITTSDPAWVRNRFYAMGSILNRLARRPRRVGFYTTGQYLLPRSLAYRQNFLEGIPGP